MGAYLADKDWIGLIDAPLESEVGRPGSQAVDEGDYTLQLTWNNKQEPFTTRMGLISTVVSQVLDSSRSLTTRMEISPLVSTGMVRETSSCQVRILKPMRPG